MRQVYFDNNSTTPLAPEALEAMTPFLTHQFGNPSSAHAFGAIAAQAVSRARSQIAQLIGAQPEQVLFCASATEAINWVLGARSGPLILSAVEHAATLAVCARRKEEGSETTVLPVNADGQIQLEEFERHLSRDNCTVSLMWANNETGVIFPIERISKICRAHDAYLHVDAVQAAGKLPIDFAGLAIDSMVVSSHKLFGPKGIAALVVRQPDLLTPLILGGGQEHGRRGGTENVPAIVGFGVAAQLALRLRDDRVRYTKALRDRLETEILHRIRRTWINGCDSFRLANTSNIGFDNIDAEALTGILDGHGIAVSTGSACHARSLEPSHVIRAMTGSFQKASESIRFSLSHLNSREEVDYVVDVLCSGAAQLR